MPMHALRLALLVVGALLIGAAIGFAFEEHIQLTTGAKSGEGDNE
jgi:hypothetical protein